MAPALLHCLVDREAGGETFANRDNSHVTTSAAPRLRTLALIFLGVLGAVQGAAPNIASTALIGAGRDLGMTGGMLALAASAQTLAIAASVISTGLLADRLGRRKVLIAALVVGAAGNLLVASAANPLTYLAGEALIGIGFGAVYAAAFAYIQVLAEPGKIPAAIGIFVASAGGFALGFTLLGGFLASIDWRVAYLALPIVSGLSILATLWLIPALPGMQVSRDMIGQVLLALGLVSFLYGVSRLADSLSSPLSWGPILIGAALIGATLWRQSRVGNAFFPVALFRSPFFLAAICAGFVYNLGNSVSFLQVTNLWQYVTGLKTSEVSLWQLPLLASGIIAALWFGRLMARGMSNQTALLIGGVVSAVGFVALSLAHDSKSFWEFFPGLVLTGAGFTIASMPFGSLILKEAPPAFFGPVTSSRTTFGQLFYSLGLALSTVVIDQLTRGGIVDKLSAAGVPPTQIGSGLDAVSAYASNSTAPSSSVGQAALSDATASYVLAFQSLMFGVAVVILVVALIGVRLIQRAERANTAPTP